MKTAQFNSYGILAIENYIPKLHISQSAFELAKGIPKNKITIGLGQTHMSLVSPLEDANSMALTVLNNLLNRTKTSPSQIGKLEFATETIHDKSKSAKTILMELLKDNKDVEGVGNINACYGGTAALFNCVSWGIAEGDGRLSVVVMSDVAVYNELAAQPTGGAGAIAILLGPQPVISLEPIRASYFADVYDFFKPDMASEFPTVDGKLSMKIYMEALSRCFQGLKIKYEREGKKVGLVDFDFFCFHCPFAKQVEKGFLRIMYDEIINGGYVKDDKDFDYFIKEKPSFNERITQKNLKDLLIKDELPNKLYKGLLLNREIGNIYTGSLYLSLISTVLNNDGQSLKGKRVFMYSYGSGAAASVFGLKFNDNFTKEKLLDIDYLNHQMNHRTKIGINKFEALNKRRELLYNKKGFINELESDYLWDKSYYLQSVDDKGRRVYKYWEGVGQRRLTGFSSVLSKPTKFRQMGVIDRRNFISKETGLVTDELVSNKGLTLEIADNMIENLIGVIKLPVGMGLHFVINGAKKLIPMVTEEPSVIAAASNSAKLICSHSAGFHSISSRNVVRGQIFVQDFKNRNFSQSLKSNKERLISLANDRYCPQIVRRGGGVVDMIVRSLDAQTLTVFVLVDVQDSMGANTVNTVLEGLRPEIEKLMQGETLMCIISNLCPERVIKASFEIPVDVLKTSQFSGRKVAERIISANDIAKKDLFRATTHNKGIMNGVSAVCLAVGQDIRAIEAACHTYSIYKHGFYRPLTEYKLTDNKRKFKGEIEMPFIVGPKGGMTNTNPLYQFNLKLLGSPDGRELGNILGSVGLAQNFAALKALVTEGIQKGHMRLHARNVAMGVGVGVEDISEAVDFMINRQSITPETAKLFLKKYKGN